MSAAPTLPAEVLAQIRAPFLALEATQIDPPTLVPLGLILELSGEAMREQLIVAQTNGGSELALRPDFTIAAARLHLAGGRDDGRYFYEGNAFRAAPQSGEGHDEFLQIGVEAFETGDAPGADAEMAALAWRAASAGGRRDLALRFGDVGLFAAFLETLGLAEPLRLRLRRMFTSPRRLARTLEPDAAATGPANGDRLARLLARLPEAEAVGVLEDLWALAGVEPSAGRSAAEIVHRLGARAAVADAPSLTAEQASSIRSFLAITAEPAAALEKVARLAAGDAKSLDAALEAWARRLSRLAAEGIAAGATSLSTAFGREFAYYDGVFFEVRSQALGEDRPLAAGGRYDGLFARLGARLGCGAVGCMVRPGRAWAGGEG